MDFFDNTLPIGEYIDQQNNLNQMKNSLQAQNIARLYQTHSSIVHTLKDLPKNRLIGDGLITTTPSLALCIRTADCAPILMAHKSKPIIATVHAGWRGAILGKIIENAAAQLKTMDSLENYVVAIGPCMHQKNFETGPIIYNNVPPRFLDHKKYFNLPLYIQNKLEILGFKDIEIMNIDTYDNPDFFSNRYATHQSQKLLDRQGSAICLT